MYVLDRRADINLESFRRVAWEGEPIALSDAARERIAAARRAFLGYIEAHPDRRVYGANTRVGPGVKTVLRGGDLRTQSARRPGAAGVSFGEKLPPRAVRGILLARLANFVEGNSGVSLAVVEAVSDMLDGRALPAVPGRGNGAAGEINALGHLFFELADRVEMGPKDNSALTNGSPCASALVADAALMARRRIDLATQVFALAIEGFRAPLEHYDPVLADCWGNPHDRTALYALAPYLEGAAGERRAWQAPVSFRVIPRLLGQAFHALLQAQECARWSLASITDNPTYLPPGSEHAPATEFPHGRVLHAGGFHNAAAYNAMDSLSGAWADLVLLTDRLCAKTLDGNVSGLPHGLDGGAVYDAPRYLPGALVAIGEQARRAAQRTFLPGSGEYAAQGQSDIGTPVFAAWYADAEAGDCLLAALAVLAATSVRALDVGGRMPAPALHGLYVNVRELVPPLDAPRLLGPDLEALHRQFRREVCDAPSGELPRHGAS